MLRKVVDRAIGRPAPDAGGGAVSELRSQLDDLRRTVADLGRQVKELRGELAQLREHRAAAAPEPVAGDEADEEPAPAEELVEPVEAPPEPVEAQAPPAVAPAPAAIGIAAAVASAATATAPAPPPRSAVSFTSAPAEQSTGQLAGSVQLASDGAAYWGLIDNESARARAKGEQLVIDQEECIACGTCVENTDAVFSLPDDAKAAVLRQEGPMDLVQDAIDACPVTCIHWTDEPGRFVQLNDAAGKPLD